MNSLIKALRDTGSPMAAAAIKSNVVKIVHSVGGDLVHADQEEIASAMLEYVAQLTHENRWPKDVANYIYTMARNKASHIRKQMVKEKLYVESLDLSMWSGDMGEDEAKVEAIEECMPLLSPEQRMVLRMKSLGCTQKEIEENLHMSAYAVKGFYKKAIVAMRKHLKERGFTVPKK